MSSQHRCQDALAVTLTAVQQAQGTKRQKPIPKPVNVNRSDTGRICGSSKLSLGLDVDLSIDLVRRQRVHPLQALSRLSLNIGSRSCYTVHCVDSCVVTVSSLAALAFWSVPFSVSSRASTDAPNIVSSF